MAVKERRARWWRPVWAGGVLAVVLCGTLLLGGAWLLARGEPAWWAALDPGAPDAKSRAEALEQGVVSAIHRARERGETWTVEVRDRDATAWLVHRFPRWLANRGRSMPRGVSQLRVSFGAGEVVVGAAVARETGGWLGPRVVALRARPVLRDSGAVTIQGASVEVGSVALPASDGAASLGEWIPEGAIEDEMRRRIEMALSGEAPALERASIQLEDGRVIRVVAIELAPGRARITCVNE